MSFAPAITRIIEEQRLSVWYSTPTALRLLADYGALDRRDLSSLRLVLFAGEVFPVPILRRLMGKLPGPRYVNLYGPTETNVCTYFIVASTPDEGAGPIPIGVAREDLAVGVFGEEGQPLHVGDVGEICVEGPGVMRGYWRRPDLTAASRLASRPDSYRTGDLGRLDTDGNFHFVGRRDHQVKIQGHRIELLEIEAQLAAHPQVAHAAVLAIGEAGQASLVAFIATGQAPRAEAAALRRHCAERLPAWAVPGRFVFLRDLPLTSTGKLDRLRLTSLAEHDTMPELERGEP